MHNYYLARIDNKIIEINNLENNEINELKKKKKYIYLKKEPNNFITFGSVCIYNANKSMMITGYGDINNYKELRTTLINKGYIFKTNNVLEVILHGYEEYKTRILSQIEGSFSFLIYDIEEDTLFVGRDQLGIKPLYYTVQKGSITVASSLKKLLNHFNVDKKINHSALENYLSFQYSVLEESFYQKIYKLNPGSYLIYKNNKIKIKKYYELKFKINNNITFDEYTDKINQLTKNIVKEYEDKEKKVATFLSSGIDSSYITALSKKVKDTYTIGFNNYKNNESLYAKELAENLNKKSNLLEINSDKYFEAVNEIQSFIDEPLADPASVGLYLLCKEASKNYNTVFVGEGADEFFGRYTIYQEPLNAYYKIPFIIRRAIGSITSLFPKVRGINFLVRKCKKIEERYIGNANVFSTKERRKILNKKSGAPSTLDVVKPYYLKVNDLDDITKMQYIDINLWLVGDELFNAEMMGNFNNVKLLAPFLDKRLVDLGLTVPLQYRVNKFTTKYVLREAAKKVLPEKWYNKKKLGFPIPLRNWLREDKYYQIVKIAFESQEAQRFFNIKEIIKLLEEHKNEKKDNSRKIWVIYIFILWYKKNFNCEK